jgi:hypothetical protein
MAPSIFAGAVKARCCACQSSEAVGRAAAVLEIDRARRYVACWLLPFICIQVSTDSFMFAGRWTRCEQPLREPFVSSSTSTAPTPANRTQIPTLDRRKEEADSLGRTQVTKHDPIQHHHARPVKSPAVRDGGRRGRYRMRLAGAATMQVTSSFQHRKSTRFLTCWCITTCHSIHAAIVYSTTLFGTISIPNSNKLWTSFGRMKNKCARKRGTI